MKYPKSNIRKPVISAATVDSYRIGSALHLTEKQLRILTGFFCRPKAADVSVLGGRACVGMQHIDGIGSIVIKHYHRGGLIRFYTKRRYLRFGKTRAQREFELLNLVGGLGINVPRPIAYAYSGRLFYLAWLVTRAIKTPISLASLSLRDEDKTRAALQSTAEQTAVLIHNKILHVDLHPGNVVMDEEGQIFFLDFDKGRVCHRSEKKLTDRYMARWRRAVIKHRLPMMLNDIMADGLQNNLV